MRFLLTGAAGFVGSRVARLLVRTGHTVFAIIQPESSSERLEDCISRLHPLYVDLRDAQAVRRLLKEAKPECVVHLAWYTVPGKYWSAVENLDCVTMTIALAQSAAENGCRRFVGIGSCAEYDWDYGFLSEVATPLNPRTIYGVCKNETRILIEAFCAQVPMEFAWARLFYLFGPWEDPCRLVPSVIRALLKGEVAACTEGKQMRDFLHVDDAASAICAFASSGRQGAVNVGSGEPVSVRDIVDLIGRTLGRSDLISYGAIQPDPNDPPLLLADVRRLRKEVGWCPSLSLREALINTVQWWREKSS